MRLVFVETGTDENPAVLQSARVRAAASLATLYRLPRRHGRQPHQLGKPGTLEPATPDGLDRLHERVRGQDVCRRGQSGSLRTTR
jgi:hypothetical protein